MDFFDALVFRDLLAALLHTNGSHENPAHSANVADDVYEHGGWEMR